MLTLNNLAIAIGLLACDFSTGLRIIGCETSRFSISCICFLKLSVFVVVDDEIVVFDDPLLAGLGGACRTLGRFMRVEFVSANRQISVQERPYRFSDRKGIYYGKFNCFHMKCVCSL